MQPAASLAHFPCTRFGLSLGSGNVNNHIPSDLLQRYSQTREAIQANLDFITSVAAMFRLFEDWDGESTEVDLPSLGKLHALIYRHACRVEEHLEDVLPLVEVREALGGQEDGEGGGDC